MDQNNRNYVGNVDNNASFSEIIEAEKSKSIKIKDLILRAVGDCPPITCSVTSIHRSGLMKNWSQRDFLPFMIGDETGQMNCLAWQEIAISLSKVLEIGQCIRIIGSRVEKRKGLSWGSSLPYQITMGKSTVVRIYKNNGEIHVCDGLLNQKEPLLAGKLKVDSPKSVPAPVENFPEKVSVVRENLENSSIEGKIEAEKNVPVVSKTKIADLTRAHICECIEMVVQRVISKGVSRKGIHYFNFIGCDDTGQIHCIFREPHAKIYGSVIQSGSHLQLKKVAVKAVKEEYRVHHNLEVAVYGITEVELLPELANEEAASMGCLQSNEISLSKSVLELPKITQAKVSELKSGRMCECIELKVESFLTPSVILSPLGIRYMTFIGSDDTGKIRCTIYDPLCIKYGKFIKVGTCLKLYNVSVKMMDERFLIPGVNHPFEVLAEEEAQLQILIVAVENEDLNDPVTVHNVALGSLDELKVEQYHFVDFFGVVCALEMNTQDQHGLPIACKMAVIDESEVVVQVMIGNQNDIPPSLKISSIVVCKSILVRRINDDWECKFIPEKSVVIPITSNEIKEKDLDEIKRKDSNIIKQKDPNVIKTKDPDEIKKKNSNKMKEKDGSGWGTRADRFL